MSVFSSCSVNNQTRKNPTKSMKAYAFLSASEEVLLFIVPLERTDEHLTVTHCRHNGIQHFRVSEAPKPEDLGWQAGGVIVEIPDATVRELTTIARICSVAEEGIGNLAAEVCSAAVESDGELVHLDVDELLDAVRSDVADVDWPVADFMLDSDVE